MAQKRYALHATSPDGCHYVTYFSWREQMPAKCELLARAGYRKFELRDSVSGGIVIAVPLPDKRVKVE